MILVTNDDGIFAPGMWALAKELQSVDKVVIVAPDREQSAIGTAMTLRHPLRVRKANGVVSGVDAYAVDGTPGDSVLLAVGKLFEGQIDLVVSGINEGFNLGDDVLISGTVGAALQGYLRNLPAVAISVASSDEASLDTAARLAALIARRIKTGGLPADMFLNVNVPESPLAEIKGVLMTRPAHKSHLDSVEEGSDGRRSFYWLVRRKVIVDAPENTDIWAIGQGLISVTPLHTALFSRPAPEMGELFCRSLLEQLKKPAAGEKPDKKTPSRRVDKGRTEK
jgi:5'-nucleotidase